MTILVTYLESSGREFSVRFTGEGSEAAFATWLRVVGPERVVAVEANP